METTDDFMITPLLIGGSLLGGMAASGAFSKGSTDMPKMEAEQAVKTAEKAPGAGLSEREKKNRRLQASMLTKDWGQPNIGKAGLMGI